MSFHLRCPMRFWAGFLFLLTALSCALPELPEPPSNVAYVSNENAGITVLDLGTMQITAQIPVTGSGPRGIALTTDGRYLMAANKETADASLIDTVSAQEVRRVPIGTNPEFIKLHPGGQWMFTSHEPASPGGPPDRRSEEEIESILAGPPSRIVAIGTDDWSVDRTLTGGAETEGIEFSKDGSRMVLTNEAEDTVAIYDMESGDILKTIDITPYGYRPRGVKVSPDGETYAITLEASGTLLLLDSNFEVQEAVDIGARPYGVGFDREGERLLVAASGAQALQVLDTQSWELLAEVSLGRRCWHFTFTPDESRILVACGRSNDIYVIDAADYNVIEVVEGFDLPWGIVTYPRTYGSLDLP